MTAPERGNIKPADNGSALKGAIDQVENLKTSLRELLGTIGDLSTALKAADKEQRATNKEIEAVRGKLREIQSVSI